MTDEPEINASQAKPHPASSKALVVNSKKQPPPEPKEETRTRGLIIISFWAIVIFLGLPTWWWTTSIPRARLPLQEMLAWADGKVGIASLQPRLVSIERLYLMDI